MRRKPLTQNQRKRRERKVFNRQIREREDFLKILFRKFSDLFEKPIKQPKQAIVYDEESEGHFAFMHERKHLRRTLIFKKFH
jgi:hypothetical protein